MLNKICVDADYNIELIIWLQDPRTFDFTWDNSIVLHVNADSTANQYLVVSDGETSVTKTITPGTEQDVEVDMVLWNMGGDTTVGCYKDDNLIETFTFTFPEIIDAVGMLNQDDELDPYHLTMTGSSADIEVVEGQVSQNTEDIEDAKEDINDLYLNKQNFIDQDNLSPPTTGGENGDLQFFGGLGNSIKDLYRKENNAWLKVWLATILESDAQYPFTKVTVSGLDIGEGQPMDAGSLWIVYDP